MPASVSPQISARKCCCLANGNGRDVYASRRDGITVHCVCAVAFCGAPKVRSTYFIVGCVWLVGKSPHVCALSLVCSLITLSVVQSQNYARFVCVRVRSCVQLAFIFKSIWLCRSFFSLHMCIRYVMCGVAWIQIDRAHPLAVEPCSVFCYFGPS